MKSTLMVVLLFGALASSCNAQPHWYRSKKFWLPIAACLGSMSIDYIGSERAYGRGATEINPLFGASRPSLGHMFAIGAPIELSYALASYRLANSQSKFLRRAAFIPPAFSVANHSWAAQRAFSFQAQPIFHKRPIQYRADILR
jgi:hypothetical protein